MGGPYTVARDWWLLISCISFRINYVIRSHFSGHTIGDNAFVANMGMDVSPTRIIMSFHCFVLPCAERQSSVPVSCRCWLKATTPMCAMEQPWPWALHVRAPD